MSKRKLVDVDNARPGDAYHGVIKDIAQKGVCPFCPEHFATFHKRPVEHDGKHWLVTENMYPYEPKKHHLLIVHKTHIEHVAEILPEAWNELRELIAAATMGHGIAGGSFLLRFGDTRFTGASVTHLHAHLVQSDPDAPTYAQQKTLTGLAVRIG